MLWQRTATIWSESGPWSPRAWVVRRVRCSVSRFSAIRTSWSRSKRSPGPILAEDQDPATMWFLAGGDVVNAWLNDRVAARRLGDSHGQCIPTRRDSALRVVEHA